MKTKLIGWLAGSAAVMLLLPWAAVTFVQSDAGMAVTLLLFFAINPAFSIVSGIFAGKSIKEMWCLPVIAALLFCLAHGRSLIRGRCVCHIRGGLSGHWCGLDAGFFMALCEKTAVAGTEDKCDESKRCAVTYQGENITVIYGPNLSIQRG